MILEALFRRYENQVREGKISLQGWSKAKVSFGLRIRENGEIADLFDLRTEENLKYQFIEVPEQVKRSSDVKSNFLCDNAKYFLGIGGDIKYFEKAKELHKKILANCNSTAAQAVKNFFESWNPSNLENYEILMENLEEFKQSANIVLMFKGNYVHEYSEIKEAWENYKQSESISNTSVMPCLLKEERLPLAEIHPNIKGVRNAQSAGSVIVANIPSFESYETNAPISEYAAFAYTTTLNDLLSDADHRKFLGDITVVYWAEKNSLECQDCFAELLFQNEEEISNKTLNDLMKGVQDKTIIFNGTKLNYDNEFYILGLSPNNARLAVRFFWKKSFGEVIENIVKHYEDFKIIKPKFEKFEYIPLWQILNATVSSKSKDKSASPLMSGAVVNAIMTGQNYPVSLFQNTMLRIKAEHEVSYEKAAIIKAYLTRNKGRENLMALNEDSNDRNYVYGRIFSIFEAIQDKANPGINSTITDKYFNSACANPDYMFTILHRLAIHHLKKLETGTEIYFKKQLTNLMNKLELTEKKSSPLTLEEQGIFILGYYHQTQERYKSKEEKENG